jgi:DNA-binding transcriptional ArsR family regulator
MQATQNHGSPVGTDTVLRALADPSRRAIIRLIQDTELPAGEIAENFTLTQQAVSQHLAVLKKAGLLEERREGTRRLYRADHGQMDRLRQFLDEYWTGSLQRLQYLAESAEREKGITDG